MISIVHWCSFGKFWTTKNCSCTSCRSFVVSVDCRWSSVHPLFLWLAQGVQRLGHPGPHQFRQQVLRIAEVRGRNPPKNLPNQRFHLLKASFFFLFFKKKRLFLTLPNYILDARIPQLEHRPRWVGKSANAWASLLSQRESESDTKMLLEVVYIPFEKLVLPIEETLIALCKKET